MSAAVLAAMSATPADATVDHTVQWSNATANGNGCPAGTANVTITPNGDEIAWTFDSFGFDLVGPSSASRFCRISASAKLSGGYYLGDLKQELTYGGIKSTVGSRLSVGAQSRFFGYNLTPLVRDYPDGTPFDSLFESAVGVTSFVVHAPPSYFCNKGAVSGLFQSTLSANGQVTARDGSASMAVQGQNVTFKATSGWVACPPRP
jgi:hypothetical protein